MTAEYESKNPTPEINKNAAPAPIDPQLFFFAQPMVNGFQIVNNEPRIIMQLLYTSQKNVFIALKNDINGIVINKNGQLAKGVYFINLVINKITITKKLIIQ